MERTPQGIVWMDLCHRHMNCMRKEDTFLRSVRLENLRDLLNMLEAEYPEEIEAEKKLWSKE